MPPEVGAAALGVVWGALAATIAFRRRPLVDALWLVVSAAAVIAAAALISRPGARVAVGVAAGLALPAGWLLRRMLESVVDGEVRR